MSGILENLLVVAGQVATLFLMMAVGFILVRRGTLSGPGLDQMSHLLLYVVIPCVIIDSLQVAWDAALLADMGVMLLINAVYYLVTCAAVIPLFRRQSEDVAVALRFGVVYANTGFMGLPLIQAVLGEEAVIFTVVVIVAFNLCQWTHGVLLMGGRGEVSVRKALLNPGTIGLSVGLVFFLSGLRLPPMADKALGYLSDLNTPLAMVVIGGQMARSGLLQAFRQKALYAASALRLAVIPLLTALALLPFRLNPLVYCTAVILSGAPVAGSTGIFAQKFGRDPTASAQFVTLSTLLSILTLPVITVLAQYLAG